MHIRTGLLRGGRGRGRRVDKKALRFARGEALGRRCAKISYRGDGSGGRGAGAKAKTALVFFIKN